MVRVVVVGGGWAGCAAAIGARKAGADVLLVERTDMLLGTGLVGGIMRNNGRYTAAEEIIAMGGGELFKLCDDNSRHTNIEFPGHKHANLYDLSTIHNAVLNLIKELDIKVVFKARINGANTENGSIKDITDANGDMYYGDVFVDATGTAGPMNNCTKYGNGCAMCIIRCPSFGGRVSLAGLAGVKEAMGKKADGSYGAMSGSCKLYKESLSEEIQKELNEKGVAIIPVPKDLIKDCLGIKACQQYALKEFSENLILLDTGHAKLMVPFYDLELLRKVPGFENARYEDPYAGGLGNSMRYFAMAPRDNSLRVEGVKNLLCCGEKAGLLVGHTEAIVTGTLAGYNSARLALDKQLLEIPETLATGHAIAYVKRAMTTEEGMSKKYTFSGSVYFEKMKELGLYSIDKDEIGLRVSNEGLSGVFL